MVTTDDARWLAGYLRKMISARPAAWADSEVTLSQLIALHIIAARAPITLLSLSEALGTRPPATSAWSTGSLEPTWSTAHRIPMTCGASCWP